MAISITPTTGSAGTNTHTITTTAHTGNIDITKTFTASLVDIPDIKKTITVNQTANRVFSPNLMGKVYRGVYDYDMKLVGDNQIPITGGYIMCQIRTNIETNLRLTFSLANSMDSTSFKYIYSKVDTFNSGAPQTVPGDLQNGTAISTTLSSTQYISADNGIPTPSGYFANEQGYILILAKVLPASSGSNMTPHINVNHIDSTAQAEFNFTQRGVSLTVSEDNIVMDNTASTETITITASDDYIIK